jgi:hypothetical protein
MQASVSVAATLNHEEVKDALVMYAKQKITHLLNNTPMPKPRASEIMIKDGPLAGGFGLRTWMTYPPKADKAKAEAQ